MLTLVEPLVLEGLVDRPNLGCAMLIAACQERGIKTTLVQGQARFLKDMFCNDSDELWHLAASLNEKEARKIRLGSFPEEVRKQGIKAFREELADLYRHVITDKTPRCYFEGSKVEIFRNYYNFFSAIYFYYVNQTNPPGLKIIDRYVTEIIKSNPRYIGFSMHTKFNILSRIIRKRIKERTNIPIIVGGSMTPYLDLKTVQNSFAEELFDYMIVGAGEEALPSLIESLDQKREPQGIANVFYIKDGRLITNRLEDIRDLDSLPFPDYSQFDLDLYPTPERILPIQTSRGCSWGKCAFCSHHTGYFGGYKTFSLNKVLETMEHLQSQYKCSYFIFHDEELTPQRAKRISEAILARKMKPVHLYSYARPVDGYDDDNLFKSMRQAGFALMHWGVESGCQRVLNTMNKGIRILTVGRILKKCSKHRIANACFAFLGFPGETEIEAQQTLTFFKRHSDYIEEILMGHFTVTKMSPIGQNPKKWGGEIQKNGYYRFKTDITSEKSKRLMKKFYGELNINTAKARPNKLNYFSTGNNRRMFRFLCSGHELLPNSKLLEYLRKGTLNSIFPIILGELKKKAGQSLLYPVDIAESVIINQRFPKKEIVLNGLEEKIIILSNGILSIEQIILTIESELKQKPGVKGIQKECINFFRDMFTRNSAIGFAKSWGNQG
jgi:radical SAM superfamily enzyme YgiQ (UPF0313 family)